MRDDQDVTDDQDAAGFTDDELAFLRHVRFGELPVRIGPEAMVELTETEARRDRPETAYEQNYPYV
jgi:hypothetical protein